MRINNTYSGKTEYRIFKSLRDSLGRIYLQFKETVEVRCFPAFWKIKKVDRWYFIPNKDQYLRSYISKNDCPGELDDFVFEEADLMFHGTEEELNSFISSYPDIELYFDAQNFRRALYMDRKNKESKKEKQLIS